MLLQDLLICFFMRFSEGIQTVCWVKYSPHIPLLFHFFLSLLVPLSLNSHFVFLLSELCERVQLCVSVSVSVCIALNGLGWLVTGKKHH